jgi:hypothetical protein
VSTATTWSSSCCASPANPEQVFAFVDDQRGHPTFTADLAPALRRLALDRRSGLHHLTNDGAVSWYEFVARSSRRGTRPRPGAADLHRRSRPPASGASPGEQRARECGVARRRLRAAASLPRPPGRVGRQAPVTPRDTCGPPGSDLGPTPGCSMGGRRRGATQPAVAPIPRNARARSSPCSVMSSRRMVSQCARVIR